MQTVRLGRTGLDVSVAGLGCGGHSRLGMAKGKDVHHAADMVRCALDLGVTFIDTARAYGTEEAVGLGVKGRRGEAVISSKAGIGRGTELMSAADMARYVDDCLRKLDTDYVDVFLLHGVTPAQYPHARDVMAAGAAAAAGGRQAAVPGDQRAVRRRHRPRHVPRVPGRRSLRRGDGRLQPAEPLGAPARVSADPARRTSAR